MIILERCFEIFVFIIAYSFAFLMVSLMWCGFCIMVTRETIEKFYLKIKNKLSN
jgi:hypothetical protein